MVDIQRLRWLIGESVAEHRPLIVSITPTLEYLGNPMFVDFTAADGHTLWLDTGKSIPVKYIQAARVSP